MQRSLGSDGQFGGETVATRAKRCRAGASDYAQSQESSDVNNGPTQRVVGPGEYQVDRARCHQKSILRIATSHFIARRQNRR